MILTPQSPFRTALTGAAGVSVANAQTVSDNTTLVKQNRRLVGIDLQLRVTTSAVAYTTTASGLAALVKRIRLKVNDYTGQLRNAVDITGPALLSVMRNCEIGLDRYTQDSFVSNVGGLATSTVYAINFFIPCYNLELGEKAIPVQSIPLYKINEPAVLEVDLGTAADIGATGGITGNVFLDFAPIYRLPNRDGNGQIIDVPYIPSELKTDVIVWPGTGERQYDFAQSGYLTGFMVSNFTAALARGTIVNGAALFNLKLGQTDMWTFNEPLAIGRTDRSAKTGYPFSNVAALSYRNMPNEFWVSLIKDPTTGEAWGVQSSYDLRQETMGGERCSLFFKDIAAANYISHITMFRLLPQNPGDLMLLAGGA